MKKRFFAVWTLCLLLSAALPAQAVDLEPYRMTLPDARNAYLFADGDYVLTIIPSSREDGTPHRLVRVNAQGDTVYDVELPVPAGSGVSPMTWQVYRLPDGRDAALYKSQTGIQGDYTLFFISEAGVVQEGFALAPDALHAACFSGGIVLLTQKDGDRMNPVVLSYVDWEGRTRLEHALPPSYRLMMITATPDEASGRIFLNLRSGGSSTVLCAQNNGILWTYIFGDVGEDSKAPHTLLPDGKGGVYAATSDPTLPCEAKLWRLDGQGKLLFERTVRCEPGVIGDVLLMERRGAPVLLGKLTAHSKRYYRCFALSFDEEGRAISLDGRDFTTPLNYSYSLTPGAGGAPSVYGNISNDDGADNVVRSFYHVPYMDLPQVQDVNVWLE